MIGYLNFNFTTLNEKNKFDSLLTKLSNQLDIVFDLPHNYQYRRMNVTRIAESRSAFFNYIYCCISTIPDEIFMLSKKQLEQFLHQYIDYKKYLKHSVVTSKKNVDKLQIIALCLGIYTTTQILDFGHYGRYGSNDWFHSKRRSSDLLRYNKTQRFKIFFHFDHNNHTFRNINIQVTYYQGPIYSISIPDNSICIRRNYKIVFVGNYYLDCKFVELVKWFHPILPLELCMEIYSYLYDQYY